MAKDSRFGQGVPLSRQFRGGFSVGEIQRLGRLRAKALLSVQSTTSKYSIGDTPPLAISLPERCPVCEGDALAEAASVSLKNPPQKNPRRLRHLSLVSKIPQKNPRRLPPALILPESALFFFVFPKVSL